MMNYALGSSKWPVDNPKRGHVTPEKVTNKTTQSVTRKNRVHMIYVFVGLTTVSILYFYTPSSERSLLELTQPLNIGHPKRTLIFHPQCFRGYMDSREGNVPFVKEVYYLIPVRKQLGSPAFIRHETAIWKESHNRS